MQLQCHSSLDFSFLAGKEFIILYKVCDHVEILFDSGDTIAIHKILRRYLRLDVHPALDDVIIHQSRLCVQGLSL